MKGRVVGIENHKGTLIVQLDNDQVWQQVQEPSADLGLRVGDTVTIDRSIGDYWLSGRSDATVKVKRVK